MKMLYYGGDKMKNKIAAVVLASGRSERMKENKLLMMFNGMPICEHVIKTLSSINVDIIVVTCYKKVLDIAKKYNTVVVENNESYLGQSRSVILGVENAMNYDGIIFIPADQPLISKETFNGLINKFKLCNKIVVSSYNGKRGIPNIFPKRFYNQLLKIEGDIGGREVIVDNSSDIEKFEVENVNESFDIDCLDDYIKLQNDALI